ncbi:hypothetical protein [Halosegnis longus]|uniref:Uncharacterized protein n=1 Tax=Halosegnis longus TaxID=2216012 RepID=A0AAJ4R6R1_9EURY|nr:hypothetical protein [Salella cibi]RNJ25384.1 hypothetical protein Nmn1133_00850 [Salella cibi]
MSTITTRPAVGTGTLPLAILGVLATVYGLLVIPVSILGGVHSLAVGGSFLLGAVVTTGWAGERLDLTPGQQRRAALALATVGMLLTVVFVLVNGATFESGEAVSS